MSVRCCASCGAAESDAIQLTTCDACNLVPCQELHKPEHGAACSRRKAAELDKKLFRQPESNHMGDCPICLLPMSFDAKKNTMLPCCSKTICDGCDYAMEISETKRGIEHKCPFCRHPVAETIEQVKRDIKKRLETNDPVAIRQMGLGLRKEGNYDSAFEYLSKAADLDDVEAHYQLSIMYQMGNGVEKDEQMEAYHLEIAAIAGHPKARHNLACIEGNNGRQKRAMKHLLISASLGDDLSLKLIREEYATGRGHISKEDFASALRAHQAALAAMKSPQRDEAAADGRDTFVAWDRSGLVEDGKAVVDGSLGQ
eukprot:scaffold24052_cov94-Skeletonema_dohrnii-CCMP3373.AAC.4